MTTQLDRPLDLAPAVTRTAGTTRITGACTGISVGVTALATSVISPPAAAPAHTADPAPAHSARPYRWVSGAPSRLVGIGEAAWRRVPFTSTVVALMVIAAVATGSFWHDASAQPWFDAVGYGLPSLIDGHWWTPVSGAFFALNPWFYLPMTGGFALMVGYTEWRLGTRRAMAVTIGGQLVALFAAVLLLPMFRDSGWTWAGTVSGQLDAGFSAGALAALAVVSASIRAPWRLRVRVLLVIYVLISFVLLGTLADVLHLIAVGVAMPFGRALVGSASQPFAGRPSRREWRLLAVAGLGFITVSDWVLFLAPHDGPLGAAGDQDLTLVGILFNLGVIVLIANGLRKGRRIAWRIAVAVAGVSISLGILAPVGELVGAFGAADVDADGIPMFVAGQVAWVAVMMVLVIGRHAFRAPSPRRLGRSLDNRTDRTAALKILRKEGGSSLSWMSTWTDNRYFVTGDGASVVAYQVHGGVAIALGDPIGPELERDKAIEAFVADSERLGLVPAFFSMTGASTVEAIGLGLRQLQVAEDTLLDLPTLEFRGKSWQDIRTAINRAGKEQITFRLTRLADEPCAVIAQLRAISEEWVGDKGLPELGFTLGGIDEALDPEVRVGLAQDTTGRIHGVVSWLPVHTGDGKIGGWTLDVMRRRDGGFRPVVEYLIAESALAFKAEGAAFVSLSGAPLARSSSTDEVAGLPRVLDVLGSVLEPVYGFRSLHAFKAKFQPRYASMHLVYRDEADLPRIGIALAKAYLPDTSMRAMLKVARAGH